MRIDERLAADGEPSFSFEFFPPRTEEGERNLRAALQELSRLEPTFVSVTYGAGGSAAERQKTIDIVAGIKAEHGLEAMAHLTCVSATVDNIRATLDRMRDAQPLAVADFGTAYATLQCAELLAAGAPGIHFYTLNRSPATRAILGVLRCLAPWQRSSVPA